MKKEKQLRISLEEAREWVKKGGELEALARKAFTDDELKEREWEKIKSYGDLYLFFTPEDKTCYEAFGDLFTKLQLVRKYINRLPDGSFWTPVVRKEPSCFYLPSLCLAEVGSDLEKSYTSSESYYSRLGAFEITSIPKTMKWSVWSYDSAFMISASNPFLQINNPHPDYGLTLFSSWSRDIASHFTFHFGMDIVRWCLDNSFLSYRILP